MLKGNLHTHCTLSDGVMAPAEIAARYREHGYDFIAFTDHRCFVGEGATAERSYWEKLPKSSDGLLILHGIEEEPPELGGRHLGVIRGVSEDLRIVNHPNEYRLSVAEVIDSVRRAGAHAVEVTCHGRYLERYDSSEITVPKVATDDAHFPTEIGISWVEVDAERDPDAILRAIKEGRFQNVIGGSRRPRST